MKFVACKLPFKFIIETFMKEAESHRPQGIMHDRAREVWNAGLDTIRRDMEKCSTEEELNQAMICWGRISLHEWIESL